MFEYQDQSVRTLSAHPYKHQLAIAGYSGIIQIWDYSSEGKKLRTSRKFEKSMIETITFDSKGDYLAVGFVNGLLKIISARNLKVR